MKVCSAADAAAYLQRAGVAPTRPRIEIARLLFARPVHLSAEQIIEQVGQRAANISRATVYNTLKLFCSKRLLRELHVDPERTVFDSNLRPHYHLFDVDSGEVHDLPLSALPRLGSAVAESGCEVIDLIVRVRRRQQN